MVTIRTRTRRAAIDRARPEDRRSDGQPDQPTGTAIDSSESPADPDHGDGAAASPAPGATPAADEAAEPGAQEELAPIELGFADRTTPPEPEAAPEKPRPIRRIGKLRRPGNQKSHSAKTPDPVKKITGKGGADATKIVLILVETVAARELGEHARFTPDERKLIEPSMARILDRMTPDVAAKVSALADPLMLGTGLLIWGVRVYGHGAPARPPAPTPGPEGGIPAPPPPPNPNDPLNGVAPANGDLRRDWGRTA